QEPYENTHPPLGKLIIAAGISIFGFNPFGWRIMGVLFASLMLPITYIIGKKIIGSWIGGLASSFLLMFDFMHFTLSRIATIDTFLVFFLLCSQLFFITYFLEVLETGWSTSLHPYFLGVFMLALGFSVKWTALFSFVGNLFYIGVLRLYYTPKKVEYASDYILTNKKIIYAVCGTIAIFGLVYFLSYVPYMNLGHSLNEVYNRQWSMLDYHSTLTVKHSFSSPWWSWPLILRPVWLYISYLGEKSVSTITLMGNPMFWWIGFITIFDLFKNAINEKKPLTIYLVAIFLFQWIPYSLISRDLFLYHFYPNIILLALSTSLMIHKLWSEYKNRKRVITYLILIVALFGLFYPIISGNIVSTWWRDLLKWFPSWVF
ncbi:phospholipid carrier-dependent glycosyltransferase, partial [Candidatus Bathyarchaeota archaeon]